MRPERVGGRRQTGTERRVRFDRSRAESLADGGVEGFRRAVARVARIVPTVGDR